MDNASNYPSCIKIPPVNSKQGTSGMFSQKFDVKEAQTFNNELILLANRIFGEGNWSHAVTNQTIDFVESSMGKYVCGCATFIKIQLQNGTFHEDMGYCHAEGAMKGLAIHCARIGSLVDAFKKVLICFGNEVENEIQKLSKQLSKAPVPVNQKEDLHCTLSSVSEDLLEPCARSTPLMTRKTEELTDKSVNMPRSKSPNPLKGQIPIRSRSPMEQRGQPVLPKTPIDSKSHIHINGTNHQKEYENVQKEQESKKALTEEEILRMERKRKQMEKQAEYKRLMMEKEKKVTPKY